MIREFRNYLSLLLTALCCFPLQATMTFINKCERYDSQKPELIIKTKSEKTRLKGFSSEKKIAIKDINSDEYPIKVGIELAVSDIFSDEISNPKANEFIFYCDKGHGGYWTASEAQ